MFSTKCAMDIATAVSPRKELARTLNMYDNQLVLDKMSELDGFVSPIGILLARSDTLMIIQVISELLSIPASDKHVLNWILAAVWMNKRYVEPIVQRLVEALASVRTSPRRVVSIICLMIDTRGTTHSRRDGILREDTAECTRVLLSILGSRHPFSVIMPIHVSLAAVCTDWLHNMFDKQRLQLPNKRQTMAFIQAVTPAFRQMRGAGSTSPEWVISVCNWGATGGQPEKKIVQHLVETHCTLILLEIVKQSYCQASLFGTGPQTELHSGVFSELVCAIDRIPSRAFAIMDCLPVLQPAFKCSNSYCTFNLFVDMALNGKAPERFVTWIISVLEHLEATSDPRFIEHLHAGCSMSAFLTHKYSFVLVALQRWGAVSPNNRVIRLLKRMAAPIEPLHVSEASDGFISHIVKSVNLPPFPPMFHGISFTMSNGVAVKVLRKFTQDQTFSRWNIFWEFLLSHVTALPQFLALRLHSSRDYLPDEMVQQRIFRNVLYTALTDKCVCHSRSVFTTLVREVGNEYRTAHVKRIAEKISEPYETVELMVEQVMEQFKGLYYSPRFPRALKFSCFKVLTAKPTDSHLFDPTLIYGLHRHAPLFMFSSVHLNLARTVLLAGIKIQGDREHSLYKVSIPYEMLLRVIEFATCLLGE